MKNLMEGFFERQPNIEVSRHLLSKKEENFPLFYTLR